MNDNAPPAEEVERLEGAYDYAMQHQRELERARDADRRTAMREAENKIDADLNARYGNRITEARTATQKAHRELQDAKIAVGRVRLAAMYQGDLVNWKRPRYHFEKYEPGARGKLMVRDHDTKFPANVEHGLPEIGDVFIRLYNKGTGELGLRYARIWGKIPSDWLPEGEKPVDDRKFDKSDAV